MQWGLKNRLSRIFSPETGRTVMLAVDHGYFLGPTRKLEDPRATITPLLPYADALMLTRGILRNCVDPEAGIPTVLRVSGGASIIGPSLAAEGLTTSIEEAIRLNVSAITMSIFVGTEHERETLLNLSKLVDAGEKYGIPVLAVTAVGKELEKRDARFLSLCCRIAAELGSHYVKTYYCEDFEKVVESCPVPIVIAGGPQLDTFKDTLQLAHDAIAKGARGVDMGRNIWQSDHPVAALRAVRGVVQENMKVDEAFELFEKPLERIGGTDWMKAAVYYNNDDIRIEEMPVPEIGPEEILVRIESSGICGSDVMEWYRIKKAPLVLGHEIAGTVERVGADVNDFSPGDRVSVAHHVPCEECRYCLDGKYSLCDMLRATNFDPGGFAEFVRVPAINVEKGTFLIPDGLSFDAAAFIEPLACVVRGLNVSRFNQGDDVLVLGSGISGLLFIKLLRAKGAGRIVATDIDPARLEAAKRMGADEVIEAGAAVPDKLRELNGGRLFDLAITCAGVEPVVLQALRAVDRGGTVLLFAPLAPGVEITMPFFDVWRDQIAIISTYAGPPGDSREAMDLLASGDIDIEDMITHRLPLDRTAEGFRLVAEGSESIKVIIKPRE